ncbi:tetratricopeptide repeat domain protein [Malassezia restricta]|uniref:tetratricopeptide repeat domain protein n=1 Tax=Malassezia restricta TaxID=76775 RepID=UPI000DD13C8F|nr:tetratricopeptide repeat domain protein [Malassezia restricta]AXA51211.1 tetratricopeptide repeat domain protein [Malassezia restricta]
MSWLVRAGRYAMPMLAARARAPVVRVARLHVTRVPLAVEQSQGVSLDDPAEGEAQKLLDSGTHALEMGDLERAKGAYRKSVEVHENASAYYNLGICQYQEHDLPGAIESWTHALRLAPDSPDAHTNLASAYIMSKPPQADKALEHLTLAATQSPDDGEIHFNLGTVLEACEQLEPAIKAYRKAKECGIDVRTRD